MSALDISAYYQNRLPIEKMQRAETAKATAANSNHKSSPVVIRALKNQPIDKKSPLYQACQDFESVFIKQMLNTMRKTINKSGLLDGGMAEDIFEDMLYDEYSKKMAQNAQFGLADTLYKQLSAEVSK
jgi:Rod binding domain-containing protein